jgi:hypothetical protein
VICFVKAGQNQQQQMDRQIAEQSVPGEPAGAAMNNVSKQNG